MGKKGNEPSKKTEQKQKAKVVEDLTFGLKNKNKSKVVQKYVLNFLSIFLTFNTTFLINIVSYSRLFHRYVNQVKSQVMQGN